MLIQRVADIPWLIGAMLALLGPSTSPASQMKPSVQRHEHLAEYMAHLCMTPREWQWATTLTMVRTIAAALFSLRVQDVILRYLRSLQALLFAGAFSRAHATDRMLRCKLRGTRPGFLLTYCHTASHSKARKRILLQRSAGKLFQCMLGCSMLMSFEQWLPLHHHYINPEAGAEVMTYSSFPQDHSVGGMAAALTTLRHDHQHAD